MQYSIAIIGSGISGLAAAWLLGKNHKVTLFEKAPETGLGSNGKVLPTDFGNIRIDIPPRVFNAKHYKALTELANNSDTETYEIYQQASFSDSQGVPFLSFRTFGKADHSITLPKLNWRNSKWLLKHGADLLRWERFMRSAAVDTISDATTIRSFLDGMSISESFRESFLYPMWALMCTCTHAEIDNFPAQAMVALFRDFTANFATLRLKGGTLALEKKLSINIHQKHFNSQIESIEKQNQSWNVHFNGRVQNFDHVIVATEPRNAIAILPKGSEEIRLIEKVPTYETEMVLHSDDSLMPRSSWAPVNLIYSKNLRRSTATIWMNKIEQTSLSKNIYQTWDPIHEPNENTVLARKTFQRSLANIDSQIAMKELRDLMQLQPGRQLWFVGSYVWEGVPLLENGVRSAKFVAECINKNSLR